MSAEPYWCKPCGQMHGYNETCPIKAGSSFAAPTGLANAMKTKYQIYSYSFSSRVWLPIDGQPSNFEKHDLNSWKEVEAYFKTAVRGHYRVEKIYIIEPELANERS